jgi:hypothetical protein
MPLSTLQVINVCKDGKGSETCRYLSEDELDSNKFYCLKKTSRKKVIDDIIEKAKTSKSVLIDMPTADGCHGYPFLRHITLGYDQKK